MKPNDFDIDAELLTTDPNQSTGFVLKAKDDPNGTAYLMSTLKVEGEPGKGGGQLLVLESLERGGRLLVLESLERGGGGRLLVLESLERGGGYLYWRAWKGGGAVTCTGEPGKWGGYLYWRAWKGGRLLVLESLERGAVTCTGESGKGGGYLYLL